MNLKELSDILGVSQTTISRALNGYPEVNKDTKKRVEEAALEYGYRPSSVARRLAGKRVEAVGVIYPFDKNLRASPLFLEMIRTLSISLRKEKMDLFIIHGDPEEEISLYQRMVTGGRVDSFVVVATKREDERIKWLLDKRIPFVSHGRSQVEADYSWYDVDNYGGVRHAAEKLLELGHRRFAFVNPSDDFNFAWERKKGLLDALENFVDEVDSPMIMEGHLDEDSGYQAAESILAMPADLRPTVMLCSSMLNAKGVVKALSRRNMDVGKHMGVVAWEDGITDIGIPGMSVISVPIGHSGVRIGEMLLKILRGDGDDGEKDPATLQELECAKLILNDSVVPLGEMELL